MDWGCVKREGALQVDSRVSTADGTEVTLELTEVRDVKADLRKYLIRDPQPRRRMWDSGRLGTDDSDPKSDIRFCQDAPNEVVVSCEHLLESVKGLKQRDYGLLVRSLRHREATFVYPIYRFIYFSSVVGGGKTHC